MAKRTKTTTVATRGKSKVTASSKKVAKTSAKTKSAVASKKKSTAAEKKTAKAQTTPKKKTAKKTTKPARAATAKKSGGGKSPRIAKAGNPTPATTSSSAARSPDLTASSQDPIQFQEEKPLPKTFLSPEELAEFKQRLLAKRKELAGDAEHLANDSMARNSESGADHSSMPIHMADLGSDNWEHEFTLGLIANERDRIRKIDEALVRIEDQTYGICLATHKRIRRARLRAKPWAKYCIEQAQAREDGRA